ncbi:DUF7287 family protein [Halopiger djelfimassiliensis]|uniref:DUF7287 family protein n=1 Tax=Halopiger djelfimassiliensis TaxID=1293047 RepID=UPI000677E08B|nr:hypothetical protein [Halopiger djelfimassiliensis]
MSRKRSSGRNRTRRPRTITISVRPRAQTTQDFAVGIGVFILAVAFVFSFVPSLITPFDSPASGAETAQADRLADRIVHNLSASTQATNEINGTEFDARYTETDLSDELGLRSSGSDDVVFDHVNVSVETFDGETINSTALAGGQRYANQSAASAARIVTVDEGNRDMIDDGDCAPACRLVVRVW